MDFFIKGFQIIEINDEMLICSQCGKNDNKINFIKNTKCCKECHNFNRRCNYYSNRDRDIKRSLEYQKLNKRKVAVYAKNWLKKNKLKMKPFQRQYYSKRYTTDVMFRLKSILRKRLRRALRYNFKQGSAIRDLGCSIEEFKLYLESKFVSGMTWENYGKWHIDHIKPLSNFDLTDFNQIKEACHYTNLQPLWAIDNIKKSNKN